MQGMQGAAALRRLSVNPLTCASNAQGAEGNCNAKKWRPFRAWSQKALISYGSTGRGAPPAHGYTAESTGEAGAPCSGAPCARGCVSVFVMSIAARSCGGASCARGCVITTPSKHYVRKRASPAYRYAESTGEIGEPCSGALCASGCVTAIFSKHYVRKRMPSACGYALTRLTAGSYLGQDCRRYPLCALLSAQNGRKFRQICGLDFRQEGSRWKGGGKKKAG